MGFKGSRERPTIFLNKENKKPNKKAKGGETTINESECRGRCQQTRWAPYDSVTIRVHFCNAARGSVRCSPKEPTGRYSWSISKIPLGAKVQTKTSNYACSSRRNAAQSSAAVVSFNLFPHRRASFSRKAMVEGITAAGAPRTHNQHEVRPGPPHRRFALRVRLSDLRSCWHVMTLLASKLILRSSGGSILKVSGP